MKVSLKWLLLTLGMFVCLFSACDQDNYVPKPKGYFRLVFPDKKYVVYAYGCPFSFDYPDYAAMVPDADRDALPCWNNLTFKSFNARLHLTYYPVTSRKEFQSLVEDARTLAFKHTVKANAIDQKIINFPDRKVYGVYYEIEGNTASSVQFYLTDSTRHYFRGALYFNERPQYDSVAPVINFIKKDIDRMIDTFQWKN